MSWTTIISWKFFVGKWLHLSFFLCVWLLVPVHVRPIFRLRNYSDEYFLIPRGSQQI